MLPRRAFGRLPYRGYAVSVINLRPAWNIWPPNCILVVEMNKQQAATVEKTLRAKRQELIAALRQIDDIRIERVSEELDQIQNKVNRELAVADINRNSRSLREVDDALERLREGSLGICRHCEEPISPKRLVAIPWAALCIGCQEVADLSGGFEDDEHRPADAETDESMMQNAA